MDDVMNQVAIVTGSGRKRVGFHVAKTLGLAGYSVALHYRTSEAEAQESVAELQSLGITTQAFAADLTDEKAVAIMVERVIERFGRVDVLVNAAAIYMRKPLEEIEATDLTLQFDTNTLGTFLVSRDVGLRMCQQMTGGVIITIGDWADTRPYLDYAAYFPSKAAIPGLTRSLAVELGTRNPNVRVNAILPGPVMLPEDLPQHERDEAIMATLVKREGKPENIAQAVMALVQNDFITGVCLPVDGGRSIYAGGL
jgi:pteridine reductase